MTHREQSIIKRIIFHAVICLIAAFHSAPSFADPPAPDNRDDPESELRSFKVADGYEVHLFASENDGIVKPVQMRWDPQGRLWVSCIPSYPQLKPGEVADDRIVILADTDGNGRANYSSVFARGLSLPLGLELGHGGLYVSSGNDLLHIAEVNGSGKAGEKSVVLRGFFSGDSHQNINSFVWGPGGELMFCQGLHAFSRIETPWGTEQLFKAGVWRLRPRTLRLEHFLGNDRGPQNPWGIVFDDWGRPIMVAGNGQGIYDLLPSLIETEHFLDPHPIWIHGNIKLCDVDMIETRAMPKSAQQMLVAGSILDNSVYLFRLEENGSGFRIHDYSPLIVSSHSSFRVTDSKVGPDGAIYICDFYNPIIGHYQASLRDPNRDHAHGRIWRITAKGLPSVTKPPLTSLSVPELFDQLRSPERWVRYQVKRLLADKEGAQVGEALSKWIKSLDPADPQYEHLLVEALGIYEEQEIVESSLLKQLLHAHDEHARAYATGVIGVWQDRIDDPVGLLYAQAADESPRVRLAAVVAAAQVPSAGSVEAAASVVDRPMDEFLNNALIQAVHALKPWWKPALDAGKLTFGNKPARMEFVFKADGSADVLRTLTELVRRAKPGDAVHDNSLLLIASIGGPKELPTVLTDPALAASEAGQPHFAAELLEAMAENYRLHHSIAAGDPGEALRALMDAKDPETRGAAVALAGLWHIENLRSAIESLARDPAGAASVRAASMEALADLGGESSRALLAQIANSSEPIRARSMAIGALARVDIKSAADACATALPQASSYADVSDLLSSILARSGGADMLAQSLASAKLSSDAARLALRAMSSAGRQDAALWDLFSKASGTTSGPRTYDAALVKSLSADAIASGDPASGEKVFRSQATNCLACHSIGGAGGHVGPDLGSIGTAQPIEMVVESVLWPNKQVKEGYMATLIETRGGDVQQGYVVSDQNGAVTLRDPTTDHVFHFQADQIKRRKEIGSLMPDGVTDGITHAELRDLIRFLSELGKPGAYRVATTPLVRVWETLSSVPETLRNAGAQTDRADFPEIDPSLWRGQYANVAGELPTNELVATGAIGFARFTIEVNHAGRFRMKTNNISGLNSWLDGHPIELRDLLEVDLMNGPHTMVFRVDPTTRSGSGLSCLVEPASGGADVRLPVSIRR